MASQLNLLRKTSGTYVESGGGSSLSRKLLTKSDR
jgi:hypothetical protein